MQHIDSKENTENPGFKQKTFFIESENSAFQFTLDKKGNITENLWGTSLLITKLDSVGRPIEKLTYGKDGNLFGSDSPPIVKIKYRDLDRINQTDYYNPDLSFAARIEVCYDSVGREIALLGYDKNLKLTTKQITEYLDIENAQIKRFYDSNNELTENDCGVSIWYVRFDKTNRFEVERRYLNKNSNLIDCTHEDPELEYAYNVATQIGNTNEWKMIYYTKKGEVVREFIFKTEE
jgi:hypothetical protein